MLGKIFENFITDKHLSLNTAKSYRNNLKRYAQYHNLSLQELVDEADQEEEARVREKRRKIIRRLIDYRNYMIKEDYSTNTIKLSLIQVKTFYRYNYISIPYIPPANLKEEYQIMYDDIPTVEHIRQALQSTTSKRNRALILFMSSSGTASNETLHLTIQDFINSTKDYHNSNNIQEVINQLKTQKDIVPLWQLRRIKTDYQYYTCSSPESTREIIEYLTTRTNLQPNNQLFHIQPRTLMKTFQRINETNNWGNKGYYNFFRAHMLRKFHASQIHDTQLAHALQGRKPDSVTETYIKHNPENLRKEYLKHLDKLTIEKIDYTPIMDKTEKELRQQIQTLTEQQQRQDEQYRKIQELLQNKPNK